MICSHVRKWKFLNWILMKANFTRNVKELLWIFDDWGSGRTQVPTSILMCPWLIRCLYLPHAKKKHSFATTDLVFHKMHIVSILTLYSCANSRRKIYRTHKHMLSWILIKMWPDLYIWGEEIKSATFHLETVTRHHCQLGQYRRISDP
jgi:hypothetical protein